MGLASATPAYVLHPADRGAIQCRAGLRYGGDLLECSGAEAKTRWSQRIGSGRYPDADCVARSIVQRGLFIFLPRGGRTASPLRSHVSSALQRTGHPVSSFEDESLAAHADSVGKQSVDDADRQRGRLAGVCTPDRLLLQSIHPHCPDRKSVGGARRVSDDFTGTRRTGRRQFASLSGRSLQSHECRGDRASAGDHSALKRTASQQCLRQIAITAVDGFGLWGHRHAAHPASPKTDTDQLDLSRIADAVSPSPSDVRPATSGAVHGEGDESSAQCKRLRDMLIDTGGRSDSWSVIRALRAEGIDQLDALMLTHPDANHYGGVSDIADALPIATLLRGPMTGSKTYREKIENFHGLPGPSRGPASGSARGNSL